MIKREQLNYQDYLFLKEKFEGFNIKYEIFKQRYESSYKYFEDEVLKSVIYYKRLDNEITIGYIYSLEKGCGRKILSQFINDYSRYVITANVKEDNLSSIKLFTNYFTELKFIKNKYQDGTYKKTFLRQAQN